MGAVRGEVRPEPVTNNLSIFQAGLKQTRFEVYAEWKKDGAQRVRANVFEKANL